MFVTEDSRPMLACFFCYTKLNQCCQLQRKCLKAEELFLQMMINCEPFTNPGHLEYAGGFVKTAIEIISIVDDGQSEVDAIEIELPSSCETRHDVLEIKVERQNYDFEPESFGDEHRSRYVERKPSQHAATDSEDDMPLVEIKGEVETVKQEMEELTNKLIRDRSTKNLEPIQPENNLTEVINIAPYQPRSNSGDNFSLLQVKTEVKELVEKKQEQSVKQPTARKSKRAAATKRPKRKDDTSTSNEKKNGKTNTKRAQIAQIRTPVSLIKSKDQVFKTKLGQTSTDGIFNLSDLINNAIDTNFGNKIFNSQNIKSDQLNTNNIIESSYKCDDLNAQNVKESSYKCDVCDRSFNEKGNLRRHVIGHGEAPFKCNICERGFHAKSHLAKHHRTHTGERPFECDECHKCFSERSNLIKHLRRHTGDKPYKCDVCQRSFNQKYHLQSHSLVHTGEKPFKCDVCQQGFNRLYNFKQHYRTHTGEKPHECIICRKTFTHKTSLTNHMRNHTGEKPFKCFVCQRSFTHKQSLDMHFRKHTGEKPYKCEVCKRCFTQGSHLKQHLARNHIGDKP